jgi:hypothetical protein
LTSELFGAPGAVRSAEGRHRVAGGLRSGERSAGSVGERARAKLTPNSDLPACQIPTRARR